MKISTTAAIFSMLPLLGQSWAPQLQNGRNAIKNAFSAATVGAAVVASPLATNALDFSGEYQDPQHPFCVRHVENIGKIATIEGTDGNPGCSKNGNGVDEFYLLAAVDNGDNLIVDFTPKGGPKDVTAKWEGGEQPGIRFPDGNKWVLKPEK